MPKPTTYTVQPGDTLSGIAERYGVRWQLLAAANRINNPDLIHPGDRLTMPKENTAMTKNTIEGEAPRLPSNAPRLNSMQVHEVSVADQGREGPPPSQRKIARPGENAIRSESNTEYRRRFVLGERDAAALSVALQLSQDDVNEVWAELGQRLGFVWTTVADLRDVSGQGGEVGAGDMVALQFTAETEAAAPGNPAYEAWRAERFGHRPPNATDLREAFEAGSRHAATNLAFMGEPRSERHSYDTLVATATLAALVGMVFGAGVLALLQFLTDTTL